VAERVAERVSERVAEGGGREGGREGGEAVKDRVGGAEAKHTEHIFPLLIRDSDAQLTDRQYLHKIW
jgi:hypothetical protein